MKNVLKQELREKAKNHKTTMGILLLKNIITGKQFIQGGLNLEALVNKIKFQLNGDLFVNSTLQKDWRELGSESFIFEFVNIIEPEENSYRNYRQEILTLEQTLISEAKSELY